MPGVGLPYGGEPREPDEPEAPPLRRPLDYWEACPEHGRPRCPVCAGVPDTPPWE